ncbi:uncharacterized protein M421DRAFT_19418, partial [Didymella exigua CBS 183.55]
MHWNALINQAALRFDGGPRSFPPASDATFAFNWPYEPPNEDYEKLFIRQAVAPSTPRHEDAYRPFSCGWLVPDETSLCKPVFVAHSLLSAIWLVRASLPDKDTLPDDVWARLVSAADTLTSQGAEQAPPSAQTPPPSQAAQAPSRASSPRISNCSSDLEELRPQESAALITTVTSNNRRAEQARDKKRKASLMRKRLDLGLIEPSNTASRDEHYAYNFLSWKDEAIVAWIIKQPVSDTDDFYNAAQTPYRTALIFLEKARALGS